MEPIATYLCQRSIVTLSPVNTNVQVPVVNGKRFKRLPVPVNSFLPPIHHELSICEIRHHEVFTPKGHSLYRVDVCSLGHGWHFSDD